MAVSWFWRPRLHPPCCSAILNLQLSPYGSKQLLWSLPSHHYFNLQEEAKWKLKKCHFHSGQADPELVHVTSPHIPLIELLLAATSTSARSLGNAVLSSITEGHEESALLGVTSQLGHREEPIPGIQNTGMNLAWACGDEGLSLQGARIEYLRGKP